MNMVEIMGRYQANFSGMGVYGIAGYSASGNVSAPGQQGNNGFSVGDAGLVLSFAGFSFGGNVLFGDYNGQVGLQPKGGKSAIAWVVGAQGTQPGRSRSARPGSTTSRQALRRQTSTTQRYDEGAAASLVYAVAPGINAYVEALWGQVHQGGYDFLGGHEQRRSDQGRHLHGATTP